ncbi:hypothetical protein [Bradyrhizobium sp. CCBAU 11357]|uniref:hypothetical protein n=1 Tax=Bradyrhizobium sp. CCBAU 11357 TaxID=1630808 RepID=UPI002302AB7A|nr:hypothetical protein [Bradyrhizobium sp. CCBAU 11357]MDA9496299.1 hypothetical protein [Bradyrhizobium sp. CCBAU 11357]
MALTEQKLIEIERPACADGADLGPFIGLRRRFPQLLGAAVMRQSYHISRSDNFRVSIFSIDRIAACRLRPTQRDRLKLAKRNGVR